MVFSSRNMKQHIPNPETLLVILLCSAAWNITDCYDPMDPGGNVTVTFDIPRWTDNGYMARVTIQNNYQYRHVEKPGWQLGWSWAGGEVIWSMAGAVATHQGDCSAFKAGIPHSCSKSPVIVDRTPGAAAENWTANCCRGGLLAARAIDYLSSFSSFDMYVGGSAANGTIAAPENLTLLAPGPGYTCGQLADVEPTAVWVEGGIRQEQVFRTWKSTCTYSPFTAKKSPSCCVSLSAFYNPRITPCPACSCGCSNNIRPVCIGEGEMKTAAMRSTEERKAVGCTDHMCPIRVHWHVKSNYRDHWKVKVTVSNYHFGANYSDWNIVIEHPSLRKPAQANSFKSTLLSTEGHIDEAAIFWGIDDLNRELLQAGDELPGSVTTDIVIDKDHGTFTLRNGWAFPRRVYFNGDSCVVPMPDSYPRLPNGSSSSAGPLSVTNLLSVLLSLIFISLPG